MERALSDTQVEVLRRLRERGADWTAEATEQAWRRGEGYYLDTRNSARRGLVRLFERGNRDAMERAAAPARYAISVRREWYGPRVTHQRHLSDRDGQEWRGTRAEARAEVARLDAAVYYTASGEVGRATYTIVRARD